MSLLTDTQGTPERVWALVKLMGACGGVIAREGAVRALQALQPQTDHGATSAANQTISAAASIGMVSREKEVLRLTVECPPSIRSFADHVHQHLRTTTGPDRVLFEVYAWFVSQCDARNGTAWIGETNRKDLVDLIKLPHHVEGPTYTFNDTRIPHWRGWMALVGLGLNPAKKSVLGGFLPRPGSRVIRVLSHIGTTLGYGQQLPAERFLRELSLQAPYLDNGAIFNAVLSANELPQRTHLSRVLSTTLREMHDDGMITMEALGDASDLVTLCPDPYHKVKRIKTVSISQESLNQ